MLFLSASVLNAQIQSTCAWFFSTAKLRKFSVQIMGPWDKNQMVDLNLLSWLSLEFWLSLHSTIRCFPDFRWKCYKQPLLSILNLSPLRLVCKASWMPSLSKSCSRVPGKAMLDVLTWQWFLHSWRAGLMLLVANTQFMPLYISSVINRIWRDQCEESDS